jgi:hypothetical protein
MPNPFIIDAPAPPSELIDREGELEKLLDLAEGGHNTRLVAPRRYGKTTLLARVGEEGAARGMRWVYVDFFGVLSLGDVAARVDRAYVESLKGPLGSWFAAVRRRWGVRGRAGVPGAEVELESLPQTQAEERLHELLDLPKTIYERTGMLTLVAFDEFQEVLTAADSADAIIRSRIQHHRDEAAYVFAGSHPGLLAELFGARERPLYGQAREIALDPLEDDALVAYIAGRFEQTGRDPAAVMGDLLALVRGHPQRAMLMAHHVWEATGPGETAGAEQWEAALHGALSELQESFERYWERLSANERRVLAALASADATGDSLYSKGTLERFRLSKGTARDVSRQLLRSGDVTRGQARGSLLLVDPLLEAWIASGRHPPRPSDAGHV